MTTPARPGYVRITGPANACGVAVGQIYRVVDWFGPSPIVHDDACALWTLAPVGGVGSRFLPAWEPCEGPTGGGP